MGKSRGSKKPYKGKGKGHEDSDEEEPVRLGGQSSNVGMLPPSDSEEEEEEEEHGDKPAAPATSASGAAPSGTAASAKQAPAQPASKSKKADEDDEDDDDEDDDDDDDDDGAPVQEYLRAAPAPKKKAQPEERDPEQIRKELERLELVRKKREQDRLKRIADEGWDRYAPVSETNKPPGSVPSDHPSQAAAK